MVSGYLAIAYIVGASLSRMQVAIITGIFLVFTLAQLGGHYATMLEMTVLNRRVEHLAAPAVGTDIWPEIFLCIHLSIVVASLKFMWDVRHADSG